MSKYKELISNSLIFAIGDLTTKVILFVLMPLYTAYLSTHEYGTVDIIQTTVNLMIPIFTLSIISSVFRFSIDLESNKQEIMSNALVIVTIGFMLMLFLSPLLVYIFDKKYILYFLLMYISSSISTLFAQFIRGIGFILEYAISGVIGSFILIIVNLLTLVYLKLGAEGFLISYIASCIVTTSYLLIKCNVLKYLNFKHINLSLLKDMLLFSIYNIPNTISWWFTQAFGRYMLAIHSGFAVAGLYAAAAKLPSIINMLSSIFQQSWQLSSTKEINNRDKGTFYSNVFLGYSSLIFTSCGVVMSAIPLISLILLSNKFFNGWIYTPFLLLAAVFGCFSYFYGTFYAVFKKNKMAMVSTMVGAIINVLCCIVFIPQMGAFGVVISTVLSYAAILIIRIFDTKRLVEIKVNWIIFTISNFILFIQAFVLTARIENYILISIFLAILMLSIHFRTILSLIKDILGMYFKKSNSLNV